MYGLFGLSFNIKNVYRLAHPYVGREKIATAADLKPAYRRFINSVQPEHFAVPREELVVNNVVEAKRLLGAFSRSNINDLSQEKMAGDFYEGETHKVAEARVDQALAVLKNLNLEAETLLRLVIHSILLCGSTMNAEGLKAHGGTSSKCIGLMWLTMRGNLSLQDIVELLIHEMTHTLVFIDELNYGHFNYPAMIKTENWARSSILNRQRPMDKVVHSIVVAHEVLWARAHYLPNTEKLSVHPSSEEMIRNVNAAIESVRRHPNRDGVCSPRAVELVNMVEASVNALDSQKERLIHAGAL